MESSTTKYIAYYRVSTQKQGNSGLGLEAQKSAVINFVKCTDCIIQEFTEVESGKKADRVELNKAIDQCKLTGATLVIAKLDRLSRDVGLLINFKKTKRLLCVSICPKQIILQLDYLHSLRKTKGKQ